LKSYFFILFFTTFAIGKGRWGGGFHKRNYLIKQIGLSQSGNENSKNISKQED
jgi:hypothetical protein